MQFAARRRMGASSVEFLIVTVAVIVGAGPHRLAAATLTNSDPAAVEAALEAGGSVAVAFDGVVRLSKALLVATNTTVDATGRFVSLDGGKLVRHFVVTNGVTLRLINLELLNGSDVGPTGEVSQPGNPGWGGSIYSFGGTIEAIGCRFVDNHAVGGHGGPVTNYLATPGPTTAGAPGFGGAIYSRKGRLWLTNCLFANNSCTGGEGSTNTEASTVRGGDAFGGAIYTTNGEMSLVNVTFTNNLARGGRMVGTRPLTEGGGEAFGGALADIDGRATIDGCTLLTNQVFGDHGLGNSMGRGQGGAIYKAGGQMTVDRSLISGNKATGGPTRIRTLEAASAAIGYGGGVYNQSGSLEIRNSALTFNDAVGGPGQSSVSVRIYAGGGQGGAIFNDRSASLAVINSTLALNNATSGSGPRGGASGAALFAYGDASLVNATIVDNFSRPGEGTTDPGPAYFGGAIQGTNLGDIQLTNTILFSSSSQRIVFGTVVDGGHNICSDASANFTAPTSRNNADPLLGPLTDNGGRTPTMALLVGSPAIDAGDDSACPLTDQRGVLRPQGLACDIGAFELAPRVTLRPGQDGRINLEYVFQAGSTNRILGSTTLMDWSLLGTGVTDTNGVFLFEDPGSSQLPWRFYQVAPDVE